jgi:hypothetical protein
LFDVQIDFKTGELEMGARVHHTLGTVTHAQMGAVGDELTDEDCFD